MVPTHDAGLPGDRGERTRAICNDVGAPRGAVPREISQAEKEIPRDRTYMWNLRNKTREQAKRPQTRRGENYGWLVARWGGARRLARRGRDEDA